MARLLLWSLALICVVWTRTVHADTCYEVHGADLCFSSSLDCWADSATPGDPANMGNRFLLYNDDVSGHVIEWHDDDSLDEFDAELQTAVISHGYSSSPTADTIDDIRTSYLNAFDANVIMVDWEEAADNLNYLQSRVDTRVVGLELGMLLERLHETQDLNYDDVHLIGHSLGAHLVGFAGEYLNGAIGRITGLDPASPSFESYIDIPGCVVDKTDAQFVDIIHSDGSLNLLGLEGATGHADFYPNKGALWQAGCFMKFDACGHMRSIQFFVESIRFLQGSPNGCDYSGAWICGFPGSCPSGGCPRMGIEAFDVGGDPVCYDLDTDCYD